MKRFVVSVWDAASRLYGQPFMCAARGQAVRSFTDEVNRAAQDNALFMHPEDFELHLLSTFEDETGVYEAASSVEIECLARGKDVKHVSQ